MCQGGPVTTGLGVSTGISQLGGLDHEANCRGPVSLDSPGLPSGPQTVDLPPGPVFTCLATGSVLQSPCSEASRRARPVHQIMRLMTQLTVLGGKRGAF